VSVTDFETAARSVLDPAAYDYYRSGALTEWTLAENEAAFGRWSFVRRVLTDVSAVEVSTTVLGTPVSLPVLVAPTAFHCLADPEGETATARATAEVGTVFVHSTLATVPLEDVAAAGGPSWFQLYLFTDRGLTRELIDRAVEAGYRAIVPTVDTPTIGIRYADQRNRFELPEGMELANLAATLGAGTSEEGGSALRSFSSRFDPSLTYEDLAWLVETCGLPVVPKGIVTPGDARKAVAAGAAGVIVSNHGGRQLDGDPATLDVVADVADAVGDDGEVFMDGGVRTGTDVVKALSLGARAVLVGRPVLWALAAGGAPGVARLLGLLGEEVTDTLRQCGVRSLGDLGPGVLRPSAPAGGGRPGW
jgi:4-hydroxymandelate oxidase